MGDLEHTFARGGYHGASKNTPYSRWTPGGNSPDDDILWDLPTLRERSRDLIRNDSIASGALDTITGNVVGRGLVPQARIDAEAIGISEEEAEAYRKAVDRVWARWSRRVDLAGRLSAPGLQEMLLRQVVENGDVFALPRRVKGRPYSLAIQLVEADRVTTPTGKISSKAIREGVVRDSDGRHTGYWIKRTHPGDSREARSDDFVLVPAEDGKTRLVYHLYRQLRPDQSRGVPWFASSLLHYKDLSQYQRAELIAAKVAACAAMAIVTRDPTGEALRAATTTETSTGGQSELLQPGTVYRLLPGEEIQGFNPQRPNAQFDAFMTRVIRSIGAGIRHPYELLSQDFSKTTYTSGRMALTEVRAVYRWLQWWIVTEILQDLYELLLEEAYLLGELPARNWDANREEYLRALWVGPGWSWVDPQKEVAATKESVDEGFSTLAQECAARGLDWEEVLEQRAREERRKKELGLVKDPPTPTEGGFNDDASDPDDEEETPRDDPAPQ